MRISDWSSDVCSSDLGPTQAAPTTCCSPADRGRSTGAEGRWPRASRAGPTATSTPTLSSCSRWSRGSGPAPAARRSSTPPPTWCCTACSPPADAGGPPRSGALGAHLVLHRRHAGRRRLPALVAVLLDPVGVGVVVHLLPMRGG